VTVPLKPGAVAPEKNTWPFPTAWPSHAQLAVVVLGGCVLVLLAIHTYGYQRWGTLPSTIQRRTSLGHRIELNSADHAELLQLPGVGDSLAQRIEDYRRRHGPFQDVNQLAAVRGVGPKTLERLRPWLRVRSESSTNAVAPTANKPGRSSNAPRERTRKEAAISKPIELNGATLEDLLLLPGIGLKRAQRIIEEREKAPFRSVDELSRVPGIGRITVDRLRPYVTVERKSGEEAARNGA
jgi:competence ComEA-like helix-hairpin-helix protein